MDVDGVHGERCARDAEPVEHLHDLLELLALRRIHEVGPPPVHELRDPGDAGDPRRRLARLGELADEVEARARGQPPQDDHDLDLDEHRFRVVDARRGQPREDRRPVRLQPALRVLHERLEPREAHAVAPPEQPRVAAVLVVHGLRGDHLPPFRLRAGHALLALARALALAARRLLVVVRAVDHGHGVGEQAYERHGQPLTTRATPC